MAKEFETTYSNKTIVEMNSEELSGQVGIGGNMFPSDIPHDILSQSTAFFVETFPQAASLTDAKVNATNYAHHQ